MERAKRAADLARALGYTPARISQLRRLAWFPAPSAEGWDVEEVRELVKRHARRAPVNRKQTSTVDRSALSSESLVTPEIEAALAMLEDGDASSIDHARAARQVCASLFAQAAREPSAGLGRIADDLKRALEEERRAEKAWLELELARGQLIQRGAAMRVGAELAKRAVTVMETIEAQIASQVEVWLGDLAFVGGDSLGRQRQISAWFDRFTRRVRELDAEALIAESQGDAPLDLEDGA